jgi:uncharacterized protein
VIVAHQNQIVMEETLDKALDRLFPADGGQSSRPGARVEAAAHVDADVSRTMSDPLATRAREHYRRAIQAQKDGNWALYGEEIRRLGEVLDQMDRRP